MKNLKKRTKKCLNYEDCLVLFCFWRGCAPFLSHFNFGEYRILHNNPNASSDREIIRNYLLTKIVPPPPPAAAAAVRAPLSRVQNLYS